VERDDPDRWVNGIAACVWFYTDNCNPGCNPATRWRIRAVLQRWQDAAAGDDVPLAELLPPAWLVNLKVAT
jgi:hypothetical protein